MGLAVGRWSRVITFRDGSINYVKWIVLSKRLLRALLTRSSVAYSNVDDSFLVGMEF